MVGFGNFELEGNDEVEVLTDLIFLRFFGVFGFPDVALVVLAVEIKELLAYTSFLSTEKRTLSAVSDFFCENAATVIVNKSPVKQPVRVISLNISLQK